MTWKDAIRFGCVAADKQKYRKHTQSQKHKHNMNIQLFVVLDKKYRHEQQRLTVKTWWRNLFRPWLDTDSNVTWRPQAEFLLWLLEKAQKAVRHWPRLNLTLLDDRKASCCTTFSLWGCTYPVSDNYQRYKCRTSPPPPQNTPCLKRFPVFKNFKLLTKVCQETTLYCAGRYLNLTWHVGETLNFKVFN